MMPWAVPRGYNVGLVVDWPQAENGCGRNLAEVGDVGGHYRVGEHLGEGRRNKKSCYVLIGFEAPVTSAQNSMCGEGRGQG